MDKKPQLQGLTKKRYLAMLALLPKIPKERLQEYTTLLLTLAALIIFGLFAINPTLSTITELKRQLADSEFAHNRLTTKITSLSSLQQQYASLESDIPLVFQAIPQSPSVPIVTGQIQTLIQKNSLALFAIRVNEVSLFPKAKPGQEGSFIFTITVDGNPTQLEAFLTDISQMNRLVSTESVTITASDLPGNPPRMTVKARGYFLP